MKKIIKIFALILFILFVFGITTSRAALTVTRTTSFSSMIQELDNGGYLTGISNEVRKANPYLYCRQRGQHITSAAKYSLNSKISYPIGDSTNGHVKAYILSASGYGDNKSNGLRQYAWWQSLGQEPGKNDLLVIAEAYQSYKNNETNLAVNYSNAATNISGNTLIYGPIQVTYSYASMTSGSYSDEWGGFDYAFFSGSTPVTSGVTLCTLNNGSYTAITTNGTNGDYNKVRTNTYINNNFYIKVDLSKVTNTNSIKLKIRENKVDYTSTVYEVAGTYKSNETKTVYCTTCEDELNNARPLNLYTIRNWTGQDMAALMDELFEEVNNVILFYCDFEYEGVKIKGYYKFTGRKEVSFSNSASNKNVVEFSGKTIDINETAIEWTKDTITGKYRGERYKYIFAEFSGCTVGYSGINVIECATIVNSGTTYESQKLFVVGSTETNISNNVKLDLDIQLTTSIEVTKKWEDYSNKHNVRPTDITLKVYRNTGNGSWTELTNGRDYNITAWTKNGNTWTATIQGLAVVDNGGNKYNFKVEEFPLNYYTVGYSSSLTADVNYKKITITNTLKHLDIDITKTWDDHNNTYGKRPGLIEFNVFRSIDNQNWEKLTKNTHYKVEWKNTDTNNWAATISQLLGVNSSGNRYYFKVEEQELVYYEDSYSNGNIVQFNEGTKGEIAITNTLKYLEINIDKNWEDYNDGYQLRPDLIEFNVFRSTDNQNWEKLTKNTHYKVAWKNIDTNNWEATIYDLLGLDSSGKEYYFKIEEVPQDFYDPSYSNSNILKFRRGIKDYNVVIDNTLKHINLSGYVWLDGQTGIKPAVPNNGIMDNSETRLENIVVYLYYKNPETGVISKIAETKTDANGHYKFEDYEIGYYYVEFEYDGINYEDTIEGGDSKAFDVNRDEFNNRFKTITYGKSNDGTILSYNYSDNKSILITTEGNGKVKQEFIMNAVSSQQNNLYTSDTVDINLGLVKRGTDIALSTDVSNAEVNINGQKTNYTFNSKENTIEIGNIQTSEQVSYNLNLYASDYNYRIRDYISNGSFKEKDYINEEVPEGTTTGEELKAYVTYELNLQNQSTETTRINEVKYTFNEKYTFKQIVGDSYATTISGNIITINLNGLSLAEGETRTLYLLFEVNNNNGLVLGDFSNSAEITSYSTDKGLIDVDSQPGNCSSSNQHEDDCDTAGVLTIKTEDTFVRKIKGEVLDHTESLMVDDVIVQLIELKTVNNKVYEYIWQETVSGTGKGLRLNANGTAIEEYTYTKDYGKYEFIGFIPGDYIVRFIYGDGKTYDMTENIIKYNGQDYKSVNDSKYNAEWYNSSSYTQGESVARDNEARRLETMAYSINIDAEKGLLLKLLDNTELNLTEKETLISIYNKYNDEYGTSDIGINEVDDEVIENIKSVLLLKEVLPNTWMCAETSKIKVAVDTENITNTNIVTTVNGTTDTYVKEISNINLGLTLRPETKIELKKYITGLKLTASNGQTIVNAYLDINAAKQYAQENNTSLEAYLGNRNNLQGIRDNLIIMNRNWQWDGVSPTEVNTILDGANLEFVYTLVVENTGDTDYLSDTLVNEYNKGVENYENYLKTKANEIKSEIRRSAYVIGTDLGTSYYIGGTRGSKVQTEVTYIRDYLNNNLQPVAKGDVEKDEDASGKTYRILRDDYTMQEVTLDTVLKTSRTTGKMTPGSNDVMFTVDLTKNPISSTGDLYFDTYIAEIMSFTNAAGRRAIASTPGNAEIVEEYPNEEVGIHEIDESFAGNVNLMASAGEDKVTNQIIIISVIAGIVLIVAGAFVVKKYVIK